MTSLERLLCAIGASALFNVTAAAVAGFALGLLFVMCAALFLFVVLLGAAVFFARWRTPQGGLQQPQWLATVLSLSTLQHCLILGLTTIALLLTGAVVQFSDPLAPQLYLVLAGIVWCLACAALSAARALRVVSAAAATLAAASDAPRVYAAAQHSSAIRDSLTFTQTFHVFMLLACFIPLQALAGFASLRGPVQWRFEVVNVAPECGVHNTLTNAEATITTARTTTTIDGERMWNAIDLPTWCGAASLVVAGDNIRAASLDVWHIVVVAQNRTFALVGNSAPLAPLRLSVIAPDLVRLELRCNGALQWPAVPVGFGVSFDPGAPCAIDATLHQFDTSALAGAIVVFCAGLLCGLVLLAWCIRKWLST